MASPFAIFRKNQRLWMAAAVLIAVLSFVVAPMLQSFTGTGPVMGRKDAQATAASWSGGRLSREQLEIELSELSIANTFLRKLGTDVREKGGFPRVPEVSPDLNYVGISPANDPNLILERKLLVAEANRLGIHFDDQAVTTFLQRFVDGKLSGEQIQKSLREVSGGRMTLTDFNRLMREELTKQTMLRIASGSKRYEERINSQGLPTAILAPPSKNWQYFVRYNRQASVEAFPVFAKDFEASVTATPTDRELRDLFEKGKSITRINQPVATEPAFMTPQMANFQYISFDIDKIIEEEKAKIAEDVLRAEYDRRVQQKLLDVPVIPESPSNPEMPPADEPAKTDSGTPETPDSSTQPTENPAATDSPRPPTLENPAAEPPAAPQSFRTVKPTDSVRLVSFQDPAQDPAPTQDPAPASNDTPATTQIVPPAAPAAPPMRTKTFEEAKDGIAREMATGSAFKILDERINEIRDQMEIYSQNRRGWERAVQEKDNSVSEPEMLQLSALAEKYGFKYGETDLVDVRRVATLDIGQSRVSRGVRQQFPFPALIQVPPGTAEAEYLGDLYIPLQSMSITSRFIFWKVAHQDAVVPSFEASKDDVIKVWKAQKAAELAEAKAKEIAAKTGTSSLVESLENESDRNLVVRPAPFTWLNSLVANFDIQLSNVDALKPIDDSFMEKIFTASPGSTIVATDAAKEIYYVVKVTGFSPNDDELMARFTTAPNTAGVQNVSRFEANSSMTSWFSALQKQLGFQSQ